MIGNWGELWRSEKNENNPVWFFVSVYVRPPDERPINLRVVSQNMQEGDLPLGKQLANELKRHHNHNNNNTDETKTPATG